MDIFRSATIAVAVILLIFMVMIMYYEFKVSNSTSLFPPYTNKCPDYSYEYYDPDSKKTVCKFNDSFRNDYSNYVNSAFKDKPTGEKLCDNLMCNYNNDKGITPCSNSSTIPTYMYYNYDPNKGNTKQNVRNIRKCQLTLDGIV